MNPLPVLIPVALATLLTALAITGWMLVRAEQRIGALQQAMNTCTTRLKELNDAHRERDQIDGKNRALPDNELFDGLLR
jgi:type II secretory pathway pseudopilin PulG